ncbi:hypothetical protein MHYP_G00339580 [Metynnis hypsauchen]
MAMDDVALDAKEGFRALLLFAVHISRKRRKNLNDMQGKPKRFGLWRPQSEMLWSSSPSGETACRAWKKTQQRKGMKWPEGAYMSADKVAAQSPAYDVVVAIAGPEGGSG